MTPQLARRELARRLGLLTGYALVSGFAGALLFGPVLGVASGFSAALADAGVGVLLILAPWNVIGMLLPPGAGLGSAQRDLPWPRPSKCSTRAASRTSPSRK